jgi:hypothetical protein
MSKRRRAGRQASRFLSADMPGAAIKLLTRV